MLQQLPNWTKLAIGKRRWLKRLIFKKTGLGLAYLELNDGTKIFLDPQDMRGPSFYLMYGGPRAFTHYELVDKNEVVRAMDKKPGVFIDIGANIGLFSFYLLQERPHSKIFAFEPFPKLFYCLKKTCEENDFKSVELSQLALSNGPGKTWLYLDEENDGGHSLIESKVNSSPKKIEIELTSLDMWKSQKNISEISAIKIDVQGAELAVIEGALQSIEKCRPSLIVECDVDRLLTEKNVFSLLQEIDRPRFICRTPGTEETLNLETARKLALQDLEAGQKERNFVFSWN